MSTGRRCLCDTKTKEVDLSKGESERTHESFTDGTQWRVLSSLNSFQQVIGTRSAGPK
jgi:hypothetical protein